MPGPRRPLLAAPALARPTPRRLCRPGPDAHLLAALALAGITAPACSKGRNEPAPSRPAQAARELEAGRASPPGGPPGAPAPPKAGPGRPRLTPRTSGTTQRLQAISPVDARVAWASGLGGTYALTTDGGTTWRARVVPGAEELQFRDVQGVSDKIAYLLAAGPGAASRVYKTADGGDTWKLQFQNQDPKAFYDCFAFWAPARGLVVADSIEGRLPVLLTADGETWRGPRDRPPAALPNEGAFAASGTCVATQGERRAWVATSGAERPRVLATSDGGETWAAADAPIVGGSKSSGAATIAFRDRSHGLLGGGVLEAMKAPSNNVARSNDGGKTWQLATKSPFPGPIFGLSYALDRARQAGSEGAPGGHEQLAPAVVATGPGGAAWSADEGDTWTLLEGVDNYWAVAFADEHRGWLVGTEGRILMVEF
ncbi:MAG TPA: hypothetical protein VFS43_23150 [Polyangiaceae bacterium]|nr:hypothetical protein [Polyangiaceae bacterium]